VHADDVGDLAQRERLEMVDAFSKNSRCRSTMKFITLSIVWRRCSMAWIIQLALFRR